MHLFDLAEEFVDGFSDEADLREVMVHNDPSLDLEHISPQDLPEFAIYKIYSKYVRDRDARYSSPEKLRAGCKRARKAVCELWNRNLDRLRADGVAGQEDQMPRAHAPQDQAQDAEEETAAEATTETRKKS